MSKILNLLDYYRDIQFSANKEAYKATCHYLKIVDGNPHPYATGIFLTIDNNYFLITAAHVIENREEDIFVGYGNNNVVKLGGELIMNSLPDGLERDDDKIDIAIFRLNEETVGYVSKQYEFITYSDIQVNHEIKELPLYSAIGFPASKNKFNKFKNELKSRPFIYTTMPAKIEVYKELGCEPFTNIIVHYDKDNVVDYKTKEHSVGPDAFGISGGGLWYIPSQLVNPGDKIEKKLVGILTEWPVRNRRYWIATRIDIFTEIIRQKYNLNIEQSKVVRVNL
jgi:hypothetical protein